MTLQKTGPLVLLMFTVLCALPAAAAVGVIPSAFAQEEDDDDQDLFPDDTNTQIGVPITDQDQGAANLGANLAANVDTEHIIEEAQSATPPEEEEESPVFVKFCFQVEGESFIRCFNTSEDCTGAEEFLVEVFDFMISQHCKGFETKPPNAAECTFTEDEQVTGVSCIEP